jgi:DNA excision repair protein ERCC-4
MVVSEDQDGKSGECSELSRDTSRPNLTVGPTSSRKGGITDQNTRKPSTVIVDMREFRSELPALIHKRGIEIEPVTLQVSDGKTIIHC